MSVAISVKKCAVVFPVLLIVSCATLNPGYTVSERTEKYSFAPAWTDQRKAYRVDPSATAKKHLYFVGSTENAGKRLCLKEAEQLAIQKAAKETAKTVLKRLKERKKKSGKPVLPSSLKDQLQSNILVNLYDTVVAGEYWEKRTYSKEAGAEKNYTAYKCDIVVRIKKSNLIKSVETVKTKLSSQIPDESKKDWNTVFDSYTADLKNED